MTDPILTPDQPTEDPSPVPASVRKLDRLLNRLVAAARSDEEVNAGLRMKLSIKRRVVAVPPAHVDAAARAELSALQVRDADAV